MLISNLTESVFRPTLTVTSGSATSLVGGSDDVEIYVAVAAAATSMYQSRAVSGAESSSRSSQVNARGGWAGHPVAAWKRRHRVGPWARWTKRRRTKKSACFASRRTWWMPSSPGLGPGAATRWSAEQFLLLLFVFCAWFIRSRWSRPCGPCP